MARRPAHRFADFATRLVVFSLLAGVAVARRTTRAQR